MGGKLSDEEKTTIEKAADEAILWLESNKEADVEEIKAKIDELKSAIQPILNRHAEAGNDEPEGEAEKDEL